MSLWLDHSKAKLAKNIYKHLLVDELQDINERQGQLIRQLAKHMKSTVLVGDNKQNIYGFRGALPKHCQALLKSLHPKTCQLTLTHRLPTQGLKFINAIGSVINDDPPLRSTKDGLTPILYRCNSSTQQYQIIAKKIQFLLSKGVAANEIACLGRLKIHLNQLKQYLDSCAIDSVECYRTQDNRATQTLQALVCLAKWHHLQSPLSLQRKNKLKMVLEIVGLEGSAIVGITNKIKRQGWNTLGVPKTHPEYRMVLGLRNVVIKAANTDPEKGLIYLVSWLRSALSKKPPREHAFIIADLYQLSTLSRQFQDWEDLNVMAFAKENVEEGGVQLMTCNAAKGQEWKYVFILYCVDGIFPIYHINKKDSDSLAEDHRLFYVGITRYSKGLYLMEAPVRPVRYRNNKVHHPLLHDISPWIKPHLHCLKVIDRRNV